MAKSVNIIVINEVIQWSGLEASDIISLQNNVDQYRWFVMICGVLNHQDLQDFSLTPKEIANYFGIPENEVRTALIKHKDYHCIINNYKLVYKYVMIRVLTYIRSLYEKSEA